MEFHGVLAGRREQRDRGQLARPQQAPVDPIDGEPAERHRVGGDVAQVPRQAGERPPGAHLAAVFVEHQVLHQVHRGEHRLAVRRVVDRRMVQPERGVEQPELALHRGRDPQPAPAIDAVGRDLVAVVDRARDM